MKAKCINEDPLGWVKVGKTYEYENAGINVMIKIDIGNFAVSQDEFKRMFELVNDDVEP